MAMGATIERGQGQTLLLLPGIQGRCEWLSPLVLALSPHFHVVSFSLGRIGRDRFFDRAGDTIDELLAGRSTGRVAVVGHSFGGLVALRYAATRPERVSHLVLASVPSPRWRLDAQSAGYVRHPLVSLPLFAVRGAGRLAPEVLAALPTWRERVTFASGFAARALRWPASPKQMAEWARAWMATDLSGDAHAVTAPTLVVTGEAGLDRVVPVASSLEYLDLIRGAGHVTLRRTGHLGPLLQPDVFTAIINTFVGVRTGPAEARGAAQSDSSKRTRP